MRGNVDLPREVQIVMDCEDGLDGFLELIYFGEMTRRARAAVLTWILIVQGRLPKDIIQKIGKQVLRTSKQSNIWGWK